MNNLYDRYLGDDSYDVNTPSDASEENIDVDDIYNRIDDIDEKISDINLILIKNNSSRSEEVVVATPDYPDYSAEIASITDAVSNINDSVDGVNTWIIVIAFIIVFFETKRMIRGAIKTFDKE